ncbi:MAG: tripartite tricarboxylate transporter substrate binding protein [Betaproteobacteria bacterium]|nr:tripartite tricarboxylate transporter substrate binding protein [Betaproteobacteria bacterium]
MWMAVGMGLTLPGIALSQSFPVKPIRLISQFVPGSAGDTSLRITTPTMSQSLGQPVVIDNRAGAGGLVAAQQVLTAPPDGYTLLASSSAFYIVRQFLVKDMPFDPPKHFTPVTLYQHAISFLVAHPSFPPGSLHSMIEFARGNAGKVTFGTSGVGTEGHLSGDQIMERTGVNLVHVPYKASALALADTVSGRIATSFSIYAAALPFINSGKIKVLAVVLDTRSSRLPSVPAVAEAIPGFEAPSSWTGIFSPAGMSPALARRIQSEFAKAAKDPATLAKLTQGGFDVVATPPEEFAESIKREVALITRLVKASGIKPE